VPAYKLKKQQQAVRIFVVTFGQFCPGLAPIASYQSRTAVPDAITGAEVATANQQFQTFSKAHSRFVVYASFPKAFLEIAVPTAGASFLYKQLASSCTRCGQNTIPQQQPCDK
jgi:hypothetical protein